MAVTIVQMPVYLDTNILFYLLENHGQYSRQVADVLEDSAKTGRELITSVITITEFLAGTTALNAEILRKIPHLHCTVFDEDIAEQAAILQRDNKLQIGDSIHLATALANKADVFFTNDRYLAKVAQAYIVTKQL